MILSNSVFENVVHVLNSTHTGSCSMSSLHKAFFSPPVSFFFSKWEMETFAMNGRALSFLGPMTQLQGELQKELLIDQIHHGSPTGHRQEEVRCIIGF